MSRKMRKICRAFGFCSWMITTLRFSNVYAPLAHFHLHAQEQRVRM